MKSIILAITLFFPALSHAAYSSSGWFTITQTFVTSEGNMHFRVYGMPNVPECTDGQSWAYLDEADTGSKAKISSLLTAYSAGQQVALTLTPVDYNNGGKIYCHIIAISTKK